MKIFDNNIALLIIGRKIANFAKKTDVSTMAYIGFVF